MTVMQEEGWNGGWGREDEEWVKVHGGKAAARAEAWAWWLKFGKCRVGWEELGGTF